MTNQSIISNSDDFSDYNGEGTVLRKAQLRLLEMLIEFDRICRDNGIQYFLSGGTCLGAVRHGGFIPWDDDIDIDMWHDDYKKLLKVLPKELSDDYVTQTLETDENFHRKYLRIVDKKSDVTYSDNTFRDRFKYKGLWIDILPLSKCFSFRARKLIDHYYLASMRNLYTINRSLWKNFASWSIYPLVVSAKKTHDLLSDYVTPDEKISHVVGTGMTPKLNMSHCFPVKPLVFEGHEFFGPARPKEYLINLYGPDYMSIPKKTMRVVHSDSIKIF